MAQHDAPPVSDAPVTKPTADTSAHVHDDASFKGVGDSSSNAAYFQMKGAANPGDASKMQGGLADGGSKDGSLDFNAHPDIYGKGGGQGDAVPAAGNSGLAHGGKGADSHAGGQGAQTGGGDAKAGGGGAHHAGGDNQAGVAGPPSAGADTRAGGKGLNSAGKDTQVGGAGLPSAGADTPPGGPGLPSTGADAQTGGKGLNGAGADSHAGGVASPGSGADGGHGASSLAGNDRLNATNFSSTSDDSADAGGARTNSGNTSLNSDGSAGNPGKQTGAGGGDIIGGGADYQRQANAGDQTNVSGARSESQQANDASAQPEKPFDASTASYDGKDFHNVSSDAAYKLSDKALGQVNQNNYDNLQGRIADLGDKMPDVVMRGVNQNGVGDMEKLAGNSNDASSQYSQGGNWFAVATNQPTDSKNQLDQLGSNFARARSYAQNGQDGGVYAFAHSDGFTPNGNPVSEQSRHLKGSGMDAAAPFSKTLTAGESNMPFDSSKFTHLSTLSGNDAYNAPLPEGTAVPSFPRQAALGNNQSLKAIDKVVSAVEAQHGDHLQAVHAEREAQQKAQAQSDSSFFSRIPDALRSWF